jgi:hypothetical protein
VVRRPDGMVFTLLPGDDVDYVDACLGGGGARAGYVVGS